MGYNLGIDLGTTFVAAAISRPGQIEMVMLGDSSVAIPSAVYLGSEGDLLTGDAASRRATSNPDRVSREFKRRLGDPTPVMLGGVAHSVTELLGALLRDVVAKTSQLEGGPPGSVVLTHPANWGPFRRGLFEEVPGLAGLPEGCDSRLITEPEAAAAHYAAAGRLGDDEIVAVYDLGGGTFDATVLVKRAGRVEILGIPEGIERLGGVDFDEAILAYVNVATRGLLDELDLRDPKVTAALARLRQDCMQAKETLSVDTDTTIQVLLPGQHLQVELSRTEFEAIVRAQIESTIMALERTLRTAGVAPGELSSVLLVGGSSRIPLVARMVAEQLGCPIVMDAHPKHAVALGAATIASTAIATAGPPGTGAGLVDKPLDAGAARTDAVTGRDVAAKESVATEVTRQLTGTPPDRSGSPSLNRQPAVPPTRPADQTGGRSDVWRRRTEPAARPADEVAAQPTAARPGTAQPTAGPSTARPAAAGPAPARPNPAQPPAAARRPNAGRPNAAQPGPAFGTRSADGPDGQPRNGAGAELPKPPAPTAQRSPGWLDPPVTHPGRLTRLPQPPRRVLISALVTIVAIGVGTLLFWPDDSTPPVNPAPAAAAPQRPAPPVAAATPAPAPVAPALPVPTVVSQIPIGPTPDFVAALPDGSRVYTTNVLTRTVTVLDTATNRVVATVPVPTGPPRYLMMAPDGSRAYVTVFDDAMTVAALAVLDTKSNQIVQVIPMRAMPYVGAISKDGKQLWVPNHGSGTVSVVDTGSGTVVKEITVPPNPHWVEFSVDGTRAYVADHESNVVSVWDTRTFAPLAQITVGHSPHSVAVHPSLPLVVDCNYDGDTVTFIDTDSNAVTGTVPVGSKPQDVTWSPDGRMLYVVNDGSNNISVIDLATRQVTATLPTGGSPTSIAVLPNGRQAYVSNLDSGTLTLLNTGH